MVDFKVIFAIFFIAVQAIISTATACFDDSKLNEIRLAKAPALLYVWSPRMALSVTQAHLAAQAAQAAGLSFTPLVDGRIPAVEWQSALKTLAETQPQHAANLTATQTLCSPQLVEQEAYLHFPTAFVLKNGEVHPQRLIGAMPAQFWTQGLQERLKRWGDAVAVQPLGQCIPQNQFIALDPQLAGLDDDKQVALGAYERISPDGRFVLRSFSGKKLSTVSLVELPGPPGLTTLPAQVSRPVSLQTMAQNITQTPFSNEAFPVQGSWRYLVDTDGSHYTFDSILRNGNKAKPLFKGGMDGFYAAAAEVDSSYPRRDKLAVRIRSLSWPNASGESQTQGEGMLTMRTLTVDPAQHRIDADTGRVNLCLNRAATDGTMYALPMISAQGDEFAALPQTPVAGEATMRIFSLTPSGQGCEPRTQFKSPAGKVTFGFASAQNAADVVYEYRGQIWWLHRGSSNASNASNQPETTPSPLNIAPWHDPAGGVGDAVFHRNVMASAFPGFTRDGRVIYAATWQRCKGSVCVQEGGYVVSDPWQSNAYQSAINDFNAIKSPSKTCITVQEVAKERADFAAFHGIGD